MPTISSILKAAIEQAKARLELLLMLAALSGILTSFVYREAGRSINAVLAAVDPQNGSDTGFEALRNSIGEHSITILFGYIALLAATSILLPLWARAVAPSQPDILAGGIGPFARKAFHAFLVILGATAMTALVLMLIVPVLFSFTPTLGSAGRFIMMLAAIFLLWLSLYFMSAAHVIICFRAVDKGMSFRGAFILLKLFTRPVIGALAVLWLVFSFVNLLLGNLIATNLYDDWSLSLSLVVNGMCMFLTSAMHMGALYSLPGIREVT